MLWLLFWPLNILIRSFGVVARPQPPSILLAFLFFYFWYHKALTFLNGDLVHIKRVNFSFILWFCSFLNFHQGRVACPLLADVLEILFLPLSFTNSGILFCTRKWVLKGLAVYAFLDEWPSLRWFFLF